MEKIRDSAGQKGTGKWTAIAALDYGIPVTLIVEASRLLPAPSAGAYHGDKTQFVESIRQVCFDISLVAI